MDGGMGVQLAKTFVAAVASRDPGKVWVELAVMLDFLSDAIFGDQAAAAEVAAARSRLLEHLTPPTFDGLSDLAGWTLTDAGRQEDERQLRVELDEQAERADVAGEHAEFVRLNTRFERGHQLAASSDAMGPDGGERPHRSPLGRPRARRFGRLGRPLVDRLAGVLARFDGYADRFDVAMSRVEDGQRSWVTGTDVDSCHTVWFQLHEDLLATLGLERGRGAAEHP